MAVQRRITAGGSKRRAEILDATEAILLEEGYAAVSSRSVAAQAGVNASNVHYYFPTLDDLLIGVVRRSAARSLERIAAAAASREPIRALWNVSNQSRGTALLVELLAAANHRKGIQAEIVDIADQYRRTLVATLRQLLPQYDVDTARFPAELIAVTIVSINRTLARERTLGLTRDHAKAVRAIDRLIDELEATRRR